MSMALQSAKLKSPAARIAETHRRMVDFWRWAYSDVAQNVIRGPFTEFLVGTALQIPEMRIVPRDPWSEADLVLRFRRKQYRIEVKSTADHQAWKPRRGRKRRKATGFTIGFPKIAYNMEGGRYKARRSHLYVLVHDTAEENHLRDLDAGRYEFWVLTRGQLHKMLGVPISSLVGRTRTLSFKRLEAAGFRPVRFKHLRSEILANCTGR
jgi:hypothetical protein